MAEKLPAHFEHKGVLYHIDLTFNRIAEVERLNPGFSFMDDGNVTGFHMFRCILFVCNREKVRSLEEAGNIIEAKFNDAFKAIGEGITNFTQDLMRGQVEVTMQAGE